MVTWSIPAFDVIRRPDGAWDPRLTETPAEDPADAIADTLKSLELIRRAKRIGRFLRQTRDRDFSPGTHLDRGCDEFPFESTYQGAARAVPDHNFSVERINETLNKQHGNVLKAWYWNNRIINKDGFYIELK
ncbi:hypothetical protein [Nonomuraea sp. NPDC049158]|uniref:NucA/NucB deoxyribonuclease domain-containing protein n=1 Tax=Nonomuraea sp. NPDC049158 TaxID=3155649 RepID=UPI0033FED33F